MNVRVAWTFARRELRGGVRGFRVFLICLALGVMAIAAISSVRDSITAGLQREGATLLGGDAEIELTYRRAGTDELNWMIGQSLDVSEVLDFRSMAIVGEGDDLLTGLTQLKAVDAAYPVYGEVELEPAVPLEQALSGENGLPGAVMKAALAERLGLSVGDTFNLGRQPFRLGAILLKEPDNGGNAFTLGPRTIVSQDALADSGLLAPGTMFESKYRLRVAEGTDLESLKEEARETFTEAGMRWRDRRDGAPGATHFIEHLGTFLILVGLAGLIVGGIGISSSVKAYLDEKIEVIATLKTLGAEGRTIFLVYFFQIGVLALAGILIGLVAGAVLPVLVAPVIEANLAVPMLTGIKWVALGEAALYGALTAFIFAVWPLARAENVRAARLFAAASLGLTGRPKWRFVGYIALALALLIASVSYFSGEGHLTVWAAIGATGTFVVLVAVSGVVRLLARSLTRLGAIRKRPALRSALASIGGPGGATTPVVLAIGLGLSVLAGIGQLDANIKAAIVRDLPDVAPSFFVVDIQPGQMDAFQSRLKTDETVSRVETAPMLRGVITRINGLPAREVVGEHWVIAGDRGITFSATPPKGAEITRGEWWPEDYAGEPQISFGASEAEEMSLDLGDRLTVNVLGRDVTGTITSFRAVDFSSAGMGFVLSMNPAALRGAPHSYIATIYAEASGEAAILKDLARDFSNATVISVGDAIDQVADIMRSVAAAITYGALASLVTGVVVLIGAAAATQRARNYEAAVFKTLGASRAWVLFNFFLRSAIMGLAAGMTSILAGAVAAWAVITFVMELDYEFFAGSAALIILGGIALTVISSLWFSFQSLGVRPAATLKSRE